MIDEPLERAWRHGRAAVAALFAMKEAMAEAGMPPNQRGDIGLICAEVAWTAGVIARKQREKRK